jgi:hypothetical protein
MEQMRRDYFKSNFIILLILAAFFCSDATEETNPVYSPVYMSYDELRTSYSYDPPQEVSQAGKIYLYTNYMFVNEIYKGIHVIDLTNPASPQNIGFIKIPGSVDIAVKDNILYADSYVDLVAINITDPASPVEISRIPDLFPYPYDYADYLAEPIIVDYPNAVFDPVDINLGVVIDWIHTGDQIIDQVVNSCLGSGSDNDAYYIEAGTVTLDSSSSGGTTGTGGSLARFIIVQTNYLYALNSTDLNIVDITNAASPVFSKTVNIGYNLGSIFVDGNNLFISSSPDIYIYDIVDALNPAFISSYSHDAGCSPVIASGNFMFATTNTANCGNTYNAIQVINISNLNSPVIETSVHSNLTSPYGLGLDQTNNILAVCDGTAGINLYSTSLLPSLTLTSEIPSQNSDTYKDIIISGSNAYVVGQSGLYIYDTTSIASGTMTFLGSVPIVP